LNYSAQYLIKVLKNNGFEFKRSKGSHHIYENLITSTITVVPPKGTFYGILKQAGIDKDQLK